MPRKTIAKNRKGAPNQSGSSRRQRGFSWYPAVRRTTAPTERLVAEIKERIFSNHFFDNYIAALLARASHAVSLEFNEDIIRSGLPILNWRVLATLYDAGGLTPSKISELTLIPPPTLTRLLQRMEAAGEIKKTVSKRDRRATCVYIDQLGRKLVAPLLKRAVQRQEAVLDHLDKEDLKRSLHHLIASCAARREIAKS